ncbi:hypothetical protein LCGC14_1661910 [marine sediment metagenome]|uniref:Uncharacterized protein n=1 Tax=marine sediment metagenome TaxID=412755 RepID=A0A0F9KTW1_9ZZZZ
MFDWLTEIEIDWPTLVLTIILSGVMIAIMWFNPLWQESAAFPTKTKILMSVVLPIIAYPIVYRQLNKD